MTHDSQVGLKSEAEKKSAFENYEDKIKSLEEENKKRKDENKTLKQKEVALMRQEIVLKHAYQKHLPMRQIIKNVRYFLILYGTFLVTAGFFLVRYSKPAIHIYLNKTLVPCCNSFFKLATQLGGGTAVAVFILILLFIRYRYFLIGLLSVLTTTIIVQSLKRIIFPEMVRPIHYFAGKYDLKLVDGVTMLTSHTFPSGHSASAFGIFLLLALIIKNKYWQMLFFFLALAIAFSRVYLSQHFLNDIYFGSLISVIITLVIFAWGENWRNPKLDQSVRSILFRKK